MTASKDGAGLDSSVAAETSTQKLLRHVSKEEIPDSKDLLLARELRAHLASMGEPPLSLIVVGDIMLGGRSRKFIEEQGPGYPFEAVRPIFEGVPIVVGNLEGPLTRRPRSPSSRNYAYRLKPELVSSIKQTGINVVALANNHLLDCGRPGVLDTLDTLVQAGLYPLGAGRAEKLAYVPVVKMAGGKRIGLLNYYWNPRTAAREELPGSARDTPDKLAAGIRELRERADRVVVIFHWGVPYRQDPLSEDRAKARYAVDCGADAVVGHHPHVIQPFEVYRGRPIFYSVGNFAFGSRNSRAEGIVIGFRFNDETTSLLVFPLYVKNRDPRVAYQPKIVSGEAAHRKLSQLASKSEPSGKLLQIENGVGKLRLPAYGFTAEDVEP